MDLPPHLVHLWPVESNVGSLLLKSLGPNEGRKGFGNALQPGRPLLFILFCSFPVLLGMEGSLCLLITENVGMSPDKLFIDAADNFF